MKKKTLVGYCAKHIYKDFGNYKKGLWTQLIIRPEKFVKWFGRRKYFKKVRVTTEELNEP